MGSWERTQDGFVVDLDHFAEFRLISRLCNSDISPNCSNNAQLRKDVRTYKIFYELLIPKYAQNLWFEEILFNV